VESLVGYSELNIKKKESIYIMICPVCQEELHSDIAYIHIVTSHPEFYTIYMALLYPDTFERTENYEYYSNLCDRIGNHYIGIKDIDECAPICIIDSEKKISCAICLEDITLQTNTRKIKKCKHIYCSDCISKWFETHKTCPICKAEADAEVDAYNDSTSS
jgi:hypothetical protein